MATNANLKLGGMTAENVVGELIDRGVSKSDAAMIASGWIIENFGRVKRTFHYKEAFSSINPECQSTFGRTFKHEDWIDGESVVQAEKTSGENGFNERFHRIEEDLESLGANVSKSFACLAEMRGSLRKLLDEVRTEINRLHSDVHDCCNRGTVFTPPIVSVPNFPRDPNQFMGMTTFGNKRVSIWNTAEGIMMLPAITSVHKEILVDPRVSKVSLMARILVEEKPIIDHFGNNAISKNELVAKFGNVIAEDGRSIRELVGILPDDSKFETFDLFISALGDREAAALRTSEGADAAIAAAFGLDEEVKTVANAPVEQFETIPSKVKTALLTSDVKTMGQLAKMNRKEFLAIMKRNGIETTTGQAVAWLAEADTLVKIR